MADHGGEERVKMDRSEAELREQVRTLQANLEANCEQATADFAILKAECDRLREALRSIAGIANWEG